MSYVEETVGAISPIIYHGILTPICRYLKSVKNVDVTPEELLKDVLHMPADSGVSTMLTGDNIKPAAIAPGKAKRKTKGKSGEDGGECIHIITRGPRRDTMCGAKTAPGGKYCGNCLTKVGVQNKIKAEEESPSGTSPTVRTRTQTAIASPIAAEVKPTTASRTDNTLQFKTWIVNGFAIMPFNNFVFKLHEKDGRKIPLAIGKATGTIIYPFSPEDAEWVNKMGLTPHPSPVTQPIDVAPPQPVQPVSPQPVQPVSVQPPHPTPMVVPVPQPTSSQPVTTTEPVISRPTPTIPQHGQIPVPATLVSTVSAPGRSSSPIQPMTIPNQASIGNSPKMALPSQIPQ